jgi:hypothetical protein
MEKRLDEGQSVELPSVNVMNETLEPPRMGANYVSQRLAGEPRIGNPTNTQPDPNEPAKLKKDDSFDSLDDFDAQLQSITGISMGKQPSTSKFNAKSGDAISGSSKDKDDAPTEPTTTAPTTAEDPATNTANSTAYNPSFGSDAPPANANSNAHKSSTTHLEKPHEKPIVLSSSIGGAASGAAVAAPGRERKFSNDNILDSLASLGYGSPTASNSNLNLNSSGNFNSSLPKRGAPVSHASAIENDSLSGLGGLGGYGLGGGVGGANPAIKHQSSGTFKSVGLGASGQYSSVGAGVGGGLGGGGGGVGSSMAATEPAIDSLGSRCVCHVIATNALFFFAYTDHPSAYFHCPCLYPSYSQICKERKVPTRRGCWCFQCRWWLRRRRQWCLYLQWRRQ